MELFLALPYSICRMKQRTRRHEDGKYHINGQVFQILRGTRAQVVHGTAYKTPGGLIKKDLVLNKWGRIVSAKKQRTAKAEKRLQRHGFFAEKGKFGFVKRTPHSSS